VLRDASGFSCQRGHDDAGEELPSASVTKP
jgi:hypothetical protein